MPRPYFPLYIPYAVKAKLTKEENLPTNFWKIYQIGQRKLYLEEELEPARFQLSNPHTMTLSGCAEALCGNIEPLTATF